MRFAARDDAGKYSGMRTCDKGRSQPESWPSGAGAEVSGGSGGWDLE